MEPEPALEDGSRWWWFLKVVVVSESPTFNKHMVSLDSGLL